MGIVMDISRQFTVLRGREYNKAFVRMENVWKAIFKDICLINRAWRIAHG